MLEKRVKRQVNAKEHRFFIPTGPGLEKLCAAQVHGLGLQASISREGGVRCQGRITDMYALCLGLSLANRVLMRLTKFHATNFRSLEKEIAAFPWELYLANGAPVNVRVAVHKCRLYHSQAIAQRVEEGIAARLNAQDELFPLPQEAPFTQQIFVRGMHDKFTLSIDACGDLLHKRGVKEAAGGAPIRETLAAAILQLSRYDGNLPLVDPMCGTGTFSTEAALIALNMPPGWHRDFAFYQWPSFRVKQWLHLRSQHRKQFRTVDNPLIFASDLNSEACSRLLDNVKKLGLQNVVKVSNEDALSIEPPGGHTKPGLIVLNPPYGLRLGNIEEAASLFHNVCRHLGAHFQGWKLAILVPNPAWITHIPFQNKPWKKMLHHGGLRIPLLIGRL